MKTNYNSQQPDVKVITHRNGEGEVVGKVHKPIGVKRGGVTQYPFADTHIRPQNKNTRKDTSIFLFIKTGGTGSVDVYNTITRR